MGEIFESSEIHEKRAILNFLLQNPTVSDRKLDFTLRKPFDTVLELAESPVWLPFLDKFRTLNWNTIIQELEFSAILKWEIEASFIMAE